MITGYNVLNRAKKSEALIYYSVQDEEIDLNSQSVYLLTQSSKFSPKEIDEIKRVLNTSRTSGGEKMDLDVLTNQPPIRQKLVDDIRRSGFKV